MRRFGSFAVCAFLMLFPNLIAGTSWAEIGEIGEFPRLGGARVLMLFILTVLSASFGAVGGRVAYPDGAKIPAGAAALLGVAVGCGGMIEEWQRWGFVEIGWFYYALVSPPTFLLGALLYHRRLDRQAGQ